MNFQQIFPILKEAVLLFCIFSCISINPSSGAGLSGWQPVNVSTWAQADIPPGWTYTALENAPDDPDVITLEALSPNRESLLRYVFERNPAHASAGELKRSQDRMMNELGFCECQYEPQFTENENKTVMKQTYIKGSEEGAVVCSAAIPGWGRYRYALMMKGSSAVMDYYEEMPDKLADHIRPVITPSDSVTG
jgi:hypothetical protein